VTPDDVKRIAPMVLCHRISVDPQLAVQGVTPEHVVIEALEQVPVPLAAAS